MNGKSANATRKGDGYGTQITQTSDVGPNTPIDLQEQGCQAILEDFRIYVENRWIRFRKWIG